MVSLHHLPNSMIMLTLTWSMKSTCPPITHETHDDALHFKAHLGPHYGNIYAEGHSDI